MISRLSARFPTLTASSFYAVAVLLAFNKFFAGQVLLWEYSDQRGGYPARLFAAEYFKEFGKLPEWSPYIFGGFPFASNTGFGDTFFPTALLRLIMPVDQGMALGFMVFIFLAGVFAFLFLRSMRLGWGASFVGGAAYMFSGMLLSMPSPGHDGKLFVSAILPLALMFIYRGTTLGDWRQYLWFGVTVGFCLLTPHFQATYYLLMASGFFWFFMVFLSQEKAESETWWRAGLLFGAALLVGFTIAAVQLLPFVEYMSFTSRGVGKDWGYATSWAMPPEETVGAFLPGFNGSAVESYFGRNPMKLHSEYLGVVTSLIALASFQLTGKRRTFWFFIFLAAYATLFGFGAHTPFYALPYNVLPFIAKTRAPSIIFFLTSLSAAVLAAFGTEYLLSRGSDAATGAKKAAKEVAAGAVPLLKQIDRRILYGLTALVVVALLAVIGGWKPLMEAFASNTNGASPDSVPRRLATAEQNYPAFVTHIWMAVLLAMAATALLLPGALKKMGRDTVALLVGLIVLTDLWAIEHSYLRFSPRAAEIDVADEVVAFLRADTTLHRVLPMPQIYPPPADDPYTGNYFMAHRLRTVLGYNGFELDSYDRLLGGKNSWGRPWESSIMVPKLWQLLGVKYVVVPAPGYPPADSLPPELQPAFKAFFAELVPISDSLHTYSGSRALLYRVANPLPYAFLVPAAWRVDADPDRIIATLLSQQFDARGLLIVPKDSPIGVDSVSGMGAAIANAVSAHQVRPGKLHFELERPAESDAFLYVAENYYPAWRATVDGVDAPVVRSQVSLMALPIKAGARVVDLEFSHGAYHRGFLISALTLIVVLAVAALSLFRRRMTPAAV